MELKHEIANFHFDSQNSLQLVANQMLDNRMKHINITYHFIIHAICDKNIELVKIEGKFNLVSALTEIILLENFRRNCVSMQVLDEKHK